MASKGKVADPRAAVARVGAMSVGEVLAKPTRKSGRSAPAPLGDGDAKKQKVTSVGAIKSVGDSAAAPRADASVPLQEPSSRGKSGAFERLI